MKTTSNFARKEVSDMTINEFVHEHDFRQDKIYDLDDIVEVVMDYIFTLYNERYPNQPMSYDDEFVANIKEGVRRSLNKDPGSIKMHPRTLNRIRRTYCA